jgi:hypothetical protein
MDKRPSLAALESYIATTFLEEEDSVDGLERVDVVDDVTRDARVRRSHRVEGLLVDEVAEDEAGAGIRVSQEVGNLKRESHGLQIDT